MKILNCHCVASPARARPAAARGNGGRAARPISRADAPPPSSPETIRWASSVGEVVFQHRLHTEEFGAECVSCHHETVAANLELPHPDYFDGFWVDCAVCHTGERDTGGRRQVRGLPSGAHLRSEPRDADREGRDPPQLLEVSRPRYRIRSEQLNAGSVTSAPEKPQSQ